MWQFFLGFGAGIYVGTYYNCKPIISQIESFVKQKCPPKKDEEKED